MWEKTSELPTEPGDYLVDVYLAPGEPRLCVGEPMYWSFDGEKWLNGWDLDEHIWLDSHRCELGEMNHQYWQPPKTPEQLLAARLQRFKEKKNALDTPK